MADTSKTLDDVLNGGKIWLKQMSEPGEKQPHLVLIDPTTDKPILGANGKYIRLASLTEAQRAKITEFGVSPLRDLARSKNKTYGSYTAIMKEIEACPMPNVVRGYIPQIIKQEQRLD